MSFASRMVAAGRAAYNAAWGSLRTPARTRTGDVAIPAPWSDRSGVTLGNALTPQQLSNLIIRRDQGYLREWVDLSDHARRTYPAIQYELGIREQALQETDFLVVPGDGSNARGARRAAAACEELLTRWRARDDGTGEGSSWEQWVAEWVAAAYYPLAAHEVIWERDSGVVAPEALDRIAERRLSYACDRFDPTPWAPRIWDEEEPYSPFNVIYGRKIADFHPDKFIIHRRRVAGGHRASEGLFATVVWYWLFGILSWRDLVALLELLGRPPVIAYYSAGGAKADVTKSRMNGDRAATPEEREAARKTVQSLSGALRSVLPDTVRLETLEHETTTTPIQLLTSERIDKYIARVINGTDGVTTIVPGARAAQEVAFSQSLTPYRADCRYAARMATILFARFIRANPDRFGANCPLPLCVARIETPKDLKAFTEAMKLAIDSGVPLLESWYFEQIGAPVPKPGERMIRTVSAVPAALNSAPKALDAPAASDASDTPQALEASAPTGIRTAVPRAVRTFAEGSSSVAVVLVPPADVAGKLLVPGGQLLSDLHVTLAMLGDASTLDEVDRRNVENAVRLFALTHRPVTGAFGGIARFSGGDGRDAVVATLDAPGLETFREELVTAIENINIPADATHGFTPHLTVAYVAPGDALPVERLDPVPVTCVAVELWWGATHTAFPLGPLESLP